MVDKLISFIRNEFTLLRQDLANYIIRKTGENTDALNEVAKSQKRLADTLEKQKTLPVHVTHELGKLPPITMPEVKIPAITIPPIKLPVINVPKPEVTVLVAYGLYNGANKFLNGHFTWQNPSTHQFDLQIPTGGGNFAYVPFMPTFMAVPRNAVGGGLSLAQGDIKGATQQFSSLLAAPLQLFGQLYANKDFYGRAIYADTDTGAVKMQKIASYLGLNTVPPFVKEAVNYIQKKGATPLYQSITTGMELPIKYGSQAQDNTSDFYDALSNYNTLHAQAVASFRPTFNQIQSLVQQGKNDDAQKILNGLSDSDYKLYTDLKSGASRSNTTKAETQFLPVYRRVQTLIQQGQAQQAQQIVNGLSSSDYKLYQSLKNKSL